MGWGQRIEESEAQMAACGCPMKNGIGLSELAELWSPILEDVVSEAIHHLRWVVEATKSPAEARFASALWGSSIAATKSLGEPGSKFPHEIRSGNGGGGELFIECQRHVGPYRADFFLTLAFRDCSAELVVEIDGHDFHERTKKQAAHDKKRDRYFAEKGIRVLRFTGSEVYRDVAGCVSEVERHLISMITRAMG